MRLNGTLEYAVFFSRFCQNHKLEPLAVAELVTLCRSYGALSVTETGRSLTDRETARHASLLDKITERAAQIGFDRVTVDHLVPSFYRDDTEIRLPYPE